MTFHRCLWMLALAGLPLVPAGPSPLQAQETLGPDLDAVGLLRSQIDRGVHGTLEVTEQEAEAILEVNGEAMAGGAPRAVFVEPGEEVALGVRLGETPGPELLSPDSGLSLLRRTTVGEVLWEGESNDRLGDARGGEVSWRSGNDEGRASYIRATVARLEIVRDATLAASPEAAAPATLSNATAGVLLLPAVFFDRDGDGLLLGRNIGIYPNERGTAVPRVIAENRDHYLPPKAFYRVQEPQSRALVTSTLTLAELVPPVFPDEADSSFRLAPVSSRLVTYLNAFEASLRRAGHRPENLHILRGFVSPTDRRRLERLGVPLADFTRFQYGDAVALVLAESPQADPPRMADINGDGVIDIADSEALAEFAKQTMDDLGMYGGLGVAARYEGPGPSTGSPYVHIDLRGWYAPFRQE